jgi:hypothetical protein
MKGRGVGIHSPWVLLPAWKLLAAGGCGLSFERRDKIFLGIYPRGRWERSQRQITRRTGDRRMRKGRTRGSRPANDGARSEPGRSTDVDFGG